MAATATLNFHNSVAGYSTVRCVSERCRTTNESHKYALYPVYVLNTSWNGDNYLFAMNGQTGKFIGNLPFSMPQAAKYYFPTALGVAAVVFLLITMFS